MKWLRGNSRHAVIASTAILLNVLLNVAPAPGQSVSPDPFSQFQAEKLADRPDEGVPPGIAGLGSLVTDSLALAVAARENPASPAVAAAQTTVTEKTLNVPDIPLAHKAYNVQVSIGFSGSATEHPGIREAIVSDISKGLSRMYGSMWNAQVAASEWLIPASEARLQRLNEAEVLVRYPDTATEKVILISVATGEGLFEVSCREFDSRVQELSPVLTERTHDAQSVPNVACRLARDSFRPVLLLSGLSIDKSELEFQLQAGTLIPPDPSAAQIADNDVLRTFIRQMDRRNPDKLKLLQKLDLCYVRVTSHSESLAAGEISPDDSDVTVEGKTASTPEVIVDSGHVRGVLISHGLVPFGGRGRSMQQIGLRQRPSASRSRVRMVLQTRPDRPLICHRVDIVTKLRHSDESTVPNVRILSDRNGDIELDVDPENPTFWLYVYSGSLLLARVPYAPGLLPQDTMKLPDDTLRLKVEGGLYLFRDQLVDSVAQKAVYMSLAKKAAAAGDVQGLEAAVVQLDALPGQRYFESELNSVRTPALVKAEQQKIPGVKRKIEKLCTAMSESLTAFYSADKRLKEAEELRKLRQSAESKAATIPPAEAPAQTP